MSQYDTLIVWANLLMAVMSATINFYATNKLHNRALRIISFLIGALATIYAVAYGILLLDPGHMQQWTSVMRTVSLFAWPIAWMHMTVQALHVARNVSVVRKSLEKELAKVA